MNAKSLSGTKISGINSLFGDNDPMMDEAEGIDGDLWLVGNRTLISLNLSSKHVVLFKSNIKIQSFFNCMKMFWKKRKQNWSRGSKRLFAKCAISNYVDYVSAEKQFKLWPFKAKPFSKNPNFEYETYVLRIDNNFFFIKIEKQFSIKSWRLSEAHWAHEVKRSDCKQKRSGTGQRFVDKQRR